MSYSKFKNKKFYKEIFSVNSKVFKISDYPDKKLNLILPSEFLFKSLKPVLEKMLNSTLDNKKVVLIPNGGIDKDRAHMSYVYLEEFTTINNMYLKQLDIDKWPKNMLIKAIDDSDVLSISGGLISRLLNSIDKSGIREFLIRVISEGKPYVGFSAGAMCVSKTTNFAEKFIGENDPKVVNYKPLGIVDFETYPHFEDALLPSVRKLLPKQIKGFAIRPSDAIIVTNGELLGAGNPIKINF